MCVASCCIHCVNIAHCTILCVWSRVFAPALRCVVVRLVESVEGCLVVSVYCDRIDFLQVVVLARTLVEFQLQHFHFVDLRRHKARAVYRR
jgi:hypothetical protein